VVAVVVHPIYTVDILELLQTLMGGHVLVERLAHNQVMEVLVELVLALAMACLLYELLGEVALGIKIKRI
jgi:hypothetical protein